MTIKSGFFNSNEGDRTDDATDINDFFQGFVTEGVLSPVGSWLQVSPGGGLSVSVAAGKAWFLDTFLVNTQARTYDLSVADINYARIDVVALDFDIANRQNNIVIVEGTPAQTPAVPTLIDTATHKQYPLAYVTVDASETTIAAGDIENRIGLSETPFATGLLQQASTEDLVAQWQAEFNGWMTQVEDDLQEIDTSGTLQELQDMRERPRRGRNIIINGGMQVNQGGQTSISGYGTTEAASNAYPGIADRWRIHTKSNTAEWDLSERDWDGNGARAFRLTCATADASLDADSAVIFQQLIEANRLGEIYRGRDECKRLQLTFKARTNTAGTYLVEIRDMQNFRFINKQFTFPGDGVMYDYSWDIPEEFGSPYIMSMGTDVGFELNFWLVAGTTWNNGTPSSTWTNDLLQDHRRAAGQTNLAGAINNYVDFTNIQLEVGEIASDFEIKPYPEALRECQRYREVISSYIAQGVGDDTNDVVICVGPPYSEEKRGIPTLLSISSAGWGSKASLYSGSFSACTGITLTNTSEEYHIRQPTFYATPQTWNGTDEANYFVIINDMVIDAEIELAVT